MATAVLTRPAPSRRRAQKFPALSLQVEQGDDKDAAGCEVFSMSTPAGSEVRLHFIGTPPGTQARELFSDAAKKVSDLSPLPWSARGGADSPPLFGRRPQQVSAHGASSTCDRDGGEETAELLLEAQLEAAALNASDPFASPLAPPTQQRVEQACDGNQDIANTQDALKFVRPHLEILRKSAWEDSEKDEAGSPGSPSTCSGKTWGSYGKDSYFSPFHQMPLDEPEDIAADYMPDEEAESDDIAQDFASQDGRAEDRQEDAACETGEPESNLRRVSANVEKDWQDEQSEGRDSQEWELESASEEHPMKDSLRPSIVGELSDTHVLPSYLDEDIEL